MTREAALTQLLGALFGAEELRTHLALEREGAALLAALPGEKASAAEHYATATLALQRHGFLDREFFDNLEHTRPGRVREIREVRGLWLHNSRLDRHESWAEGRYRLEAELGGGGFGLVWKAVDTRTGALVALKILLEHHTNDRRTRQRFFRGAAVLAELSHPAIVRVRSGVEQEGLRFYYVMDFLAGESLDTLVRRRPRAEVLAYVLQVGDALAHIHERDLLHRDVKPSNILVTTKGQARLIDFDLVTGDTFTPMTTRALGTALYAPPEACASDSRTPAYDVYSLARTVEFVLRGREPTTAELADRVATLDASDPVKEVLCAALHPDPERRTRSVERFCEELQAVIATLDASERDAPSPGRVAPPTMPAAPPLPASAGSSQLAQPVQLSTPPHSVTQGHPAPVVTEELSPSILPLGSGPSNATPQHSTPAARLPSATPEPNPPPETDPELLSAPSTPDLPRPTLDLDVKITPSSGWNPSEPPTDAQALPQLQRADEISAIEPLYGGDAGPNLVMGESELTPVTGSEQELTAAASIIAGAGDGSGQNPIMSGPEATPPADTERAPRVTASITIENSVHPRFFTRSQQARRTALPKLVGVVAALGILAAAALHAAFGDGSSLQNDDPEGTPTVVCGAGRELKAEVCTAIECPIGQELKENLCTAIVCPEGKELKGSTCAAIVCPEGKELKGSICGVIVCPEGKELRGNVCEVKTCPAGQELKGHDCVAITCPEGQELKGSTCVAIVCMVGYELNGSACMIKTCPEGQELKEGGCTAIVCPDGQELKGSICDTIKCPDGQELRKGVCRAMKPKSTLPLDCDEFLRSIRPIIKRKCGEQIKIYYNGKPPDTLEFICHQVVAAGDFACKHKHERETGVNKCIEDLRLPFKIAPVNCVLTIRSNEGFN